MFAGALHDIFNHGFKLSIIAILVLAFGLRLYSQEQIATKEADLHVQSFIMG